MLIEADRGKRDNMQKGCERPDRQDSARVLLSTIIIELAGTTWLLLNRTYVSIDTFNTQIIILEANRKLIL